MNQILRCDWLLEWARWSYLAHSGQPALLYLPTQIRFLIEGERVTCHWSNLNDALGRTKLNEVLGQQRLDLTCM